MSWIDLSPTPASLTKDSERWTVIDRIKEFYNVEIIPTDTNHISNDIDTLLVIHPAGINKQTEYAIDQFLMHGGNAMVFVDPFVELPMAKDAPISSDLPDLFRHWNIGYNPDRVVLDSAITL